MRAKSACLYTLVQLADQYGEDNVYIVSDYTSGFDHYNGEPIILLDEFRGQLPYGIVLMILQGYKQQIHARYTNAWTIWDKVVITSPMTPYEVYNNMETLDKKEQLYRRITRTTMALRKMASINGQHYQVQRKERISYKILMDS